MNNIVTELIRGFYIFGLVFLSMALLWNIAPSLPRLPGDIRIEKPYVQLYIPLPSSLIFAVLLTLLGSYLHL